MPLADLTRSLCGIQVVVWDDHQAKVMFEIPFKTTVLSVKMRRDKIAVGLLEQVQVFSLTGAVADTLTPLKTFATFPNPRGLMAISWHSTSSVLACPSLSPGDVLVHVFDDASPNRNQAQHAIAAHDSPLSAIALCHDGSRVATTSERGTLIRIFSTEDGVCLQELRRGLSQAGIYSLTFSTGARWLCVSSDAGTAHVFSLGSPAPDPVEGTDVTHRVMGGREREVEPPANTTSWLRPLKQMLPSYFASEWSFARYKGLSVPSICSFGSASGPSEVTTLVVVGADCTLHKCSFSGYGGDCERTFAAAFMRSQRNQ